MDKVQGGFNMKEIHENTPIVVTGGSGYIASRIIKLSLEKGVDLLKRRIML
jgi:type III secretion system FlhB-like substrate exporter